MKPSEIIKLARRQTGCTEDIVTTEEAYKFLNFVIEDFGAEIRTSDSWFWFDVLDIDVYAWQWWYTFESPDETGIYSNRFPISKIQSVWLLDQSSQKWIDLPVHFVDKVDINKFQSNEKPRACFITRTEINIIPVPKENSQLEIWGFNYNWEILPDLRTITVSSVEYTRSTDDDVDWARYPYAWKATGWTIIYTDKPKPTGWYVYSSYTWWAAAGTISTYNVDVFDSSENIWIPERWHYVIVEWMKYWMYGNMWVNFEAARNNCRNFYDSEKNKAIQNIVDRWQLADTAYFPNLNFLNY